MIESLRDRRDQLFGRDADIRKLLDRVAVPGLTAVVARPMMGKTWTLTEVARQCQEQSVLIGYHEYKGGESSHLLEAVANLYARWLSDSSMREQAISLWKRHSDGMVPRVGKMLGALFEKLGGSLLPDKATELVRQAFDGLAMAQSDLLSGGLRLDPLPYDQALSLTKLVAGVSHRRVVLILDAWEKSAAGQSEYAALDACLKNLDEWPDTHIVLAIRHPELPAVKDNEAHQVAKSLALTNASAVLYELGEMDLSSAAEIDRLKGWIRQVVPATQQVQDDKLMAMVDAFPGVVSFWSNQANRSTMKTEEDLRRIAHNAHKGRYAEFDQLLKSMPDARRIVAAQLAFLPRLDEEGWQGLQELVLDGQGTAEIDALIDSAVLFEEHVPTFGHDTRHTAARKWFVETYPPMIRRLGKRLIETMASRITGADSASLIYLEAMIGCDASTKEVGINPDVGYLIDAARCLFGDIDKTFSPDFDVRYPLGIRQNPKLASLIAMALHNRGNWKGERGDSAGAIADFTSVITLPGVKGEQIAGALHDRGVMKAWTGESADAISDLTAAIQQPGATDTQASQALCNRGFMKEQAGNNAGAIDDYTSAITWPGAPPEQVAQALFHRGFAHGKTGNCTGAIDDYTAAIELPGATPDQMAHSLFNRGVAKRRNGDGAGELSDYKAVVDLAGAPPKHVANALFNLGFRKNEAGDIAGAVAAYTAVIYLPDAPPTIVHATRQALREIALGR